MKRSRFTLRLEKEFAERLRKYASQEPPKLTVSKFTRKLLTWALNHYEKHGSLQKLKKVLPPKRKGAPGTGTRA